MTMLPTELPGAQLRPVQTEGETSARRFLVSTFVESKAGLFGLVTLVVLVLGCWGLPLIYRANPNAIDVAHILSPPGNGHPLGTDDLGRDVLARFLVAGQVSVTVGFAAALTAMTLGVTCGVVAALRQGLVDSVLMRIVDVLMAIPGLLFVIFLAVVFRPTTLLLVLVVGFVSWQVPARLVRADALLILGQPYTEAARQMGASDFRLAMRYILPNAIGTIVVTLTFQIANAILIISGLSFLGFGVPPPTPSWGSMLTDAQTYVFQDAWWLIYPPGLAIILTVAAVNFVGDALHDSFEVRLLRR
jgi:peptide/nickel transport system permease protein